MVALTTNRLELAVLDLAKGRLKTVDASPAREIADPVFSPDGRWLAYTKHIGLERTAIFVADLKSGAVHQATDPVRFDFAPSFDPDGRHLYFLGARTYRPAMDSLQTAMYFPHSVKPYLVTLRPDLPNPFRSEPQAPGAHPDGPPGAPGGPAGAGDPLDKSGRKPKPKPAAEAKGAKAKPSPAAKAAPPAEPPRPVEIDFAGIFDRVLEFPFREGDYGQIVGLGDKVLITEGVDEEHDEQSEAVDGDLLWAWDFEKQEREQHAEGLHGFEARADCRTLLYRQENRLRVLEAGAPASEERDAAFGPGRKSGWLDLGRIRVSVNYPREWEQMFLEAWRLQQEFFWRKDLSGVDWKGVLKRHRPLLERLGSRSELSDLIWEMQGELGTSHAYEMGGDYEPSPQYSVGKLGADLELDRKAGGYRVARIHRGDSWRRAEHSPLLEPGVNVREGDLLLAVGGQRVGEKVDPGELLVDLAGHDVRLTIRPKGARKTRSVVVRTIRDEGALRYREWVRANAARVDAASAGRLGYLHVPDMGAWGLAEFHRGFLAQTGREGLVLDLRYNAGGMVSPMILEKLSRRLLAYDVPRWGEAETYPYHTMGGPMAALCNEFTGSDGDMFCHSFRLLGLGPLVGKRTWGGVVGIDSRYQLVDGTVTTQPQYSAWFHTGGWSLENFGVEPDVEVGLSPMDHRDGRDPQLDAAVALLMERLAAAPPAKPTFDHRG